ncbi:glycogen debranching N-terminal domain-containing protein [Nocardia sp. JCM 34519.1]|uniref:amylo-alpha-1,6-glucosidase n=1 Tax=unclassified Nocardia TaxID=2637762 RepID=UPI0035A91471
MTVPRIFNAGPPVGVGGGHSTITLVEASTFCLSDQHGDIHPGGTLGLFYRDARVLSRWVLTVDGHPVEQLSVQASEAFDARFLLRLPPRPGLADSTVLIERHRRVGGGLEETLTVHNLGGEDTALTLTIHIDADFADLFSVKEGRSKHGTAEVAVAGDELHLTAHADPGRGLVVTANGDPMVLPGTMNWRAVVPSRGNWSATVRAQPVVGHQRTQVTQAPADGPAGRITAWRATATDLTATDPGLAHMLRHTESDLGALRIESHDGLSSFVAAGAPWFMTLFGRDSLLTSWMALLLDRGLAMGTLRRLAKLQGKEVNPVTEEEPGRIMHEMRRGPAGDQVLGGTVYYGSADATPLFLMLLAECRRWGAPDDAVRDLLPAADAALDWIEHFGDADGDGFVEYHRKTDRGLSNQGWKDSFDAINDAAGDLAHPPIALCEVQGYVYAAWLARAELAEAFGDSRVAQRSRAAAAELKRKFNEAFWIPEKGWYAMALDRDKRPVDALASNAAHCLWTGIIDDEHAGELVAAMADPAMDSGFGLRTLAIGMGAYNPMSYHNGSVWPHDTAIAVAGLLRYRHIPGALALAEKLTGGIVAAALAFDGRPPELFCGFARDQFPAPIPYPTSCSPQAWASAAPLLLVRSFLGLAPDVPRRTLTVAPRIPADWGRLVLTDLRLGPVTVRIEAEGTDLLVRGLPDDWTLDEPGARTDEPVYVSVAEA